MLRRVARVELKVLIIIIINNNNNLLLIVRLLH